MGEQERLDKFGDTHAGIIADAVTDVQPTEVVERASALVIDWQTERSEWFQRDVVGIVEDFAEFMLSRTPPVSDGWQPIESAPKDKGALMLWIPCGTSSRPVIGSWERNAFHKKPRPYWSAMADEKLFGVTWMREHQPTHWRPLPPPPGRGGL